MPETKKDLNIGFAGSPVFASEVLAALLADGRQINAVYTQPDRPAGRGRAVQMNPVKQLAIQAQIPVYQPTSLGAKSSQKEFHDLGLDLLIVVAYGLILPLNILKSPKLGCWNIHASLLPRWRGAAPIQRAIEAGDRETGVCIMQMDEGLDTGPVILRRSCAIHAAETGGSLHDKLARLGATALLDTLRAYDRDELPTGRAQPDNGISYAHKFSKSAAEINWQLAAVDIERAIRAFNPWPVAWSLIEGERIRVYAANVLSQNTDMAPGRISQFNEQGLTISCAEGQLQITELQKAGGKRISAGDYFNARQQAARQVGKQSQ